MLGLNTGCHHPTRHGAAVAAHGARMGNNGGSPAHGFGGAQNAFTGVLNGAGLAFRTVTGSMDSGGLRGGGIAD
jgi:hypothetical protein